MKYIVIAFCLLSASAKAQRRVYDTLQAYGCGSIVTFHYAPDTVPVVRNISNETRSTFWRQVDNRPFPCKLKEIREIDKPVRYLKKMRHGWEPIPAYYKVWNN